MRARLTFLGLVALWSALALQTASADVTASARHAPATADTLLAQGRAQEAYFLSVDDIALGHAGPDAHVVAGKAAFAQAKDAALLRKKRWAKRGRDQYQAALALDPNNRDALFGLATFALRAPSGLGGGEQAYTHYFTRLEAVSAIDARWLEARAAVEAKQIGPALEIYEGLLAHVKDDKILFEYAETAQAANAADRAYATLDTLSETSSCRHFLLGQLLSRTEQAQAQRLEHHLAFLHSGTQFCSRQFVALGTAAAALDMARTLGRADTVAELTALIERLEQEQAEREIARNIAS